MTDLFDQYKVIPVVVLNDEEDAQNKLSSLIKGNFFIAEITFRNEYAPKGIEYAINHFPNLIVGAGTVINKEQCLKAIELGCKFIVSPGLSIEVALLCKERNIPYLPGCVTPTEIIKAIELGIDVIKFFPAQTYGGLKAINDLSSAFPKVKFVPTGGINNNNLKEYLSNKAIKAVGGSWLLKGDIVNNCLEANEIIASLK